MKPVVEEVVRLKKDIHPKYVETTIRCACGYEIHTRSTAENLRVEICSHCHPFYTGGGQRIVDSAGRVERFQRKYGLDKKEEKEAATSES